MTYQQETDAAKLGAVTKYLAIPVPNSEVCQTNAFGAALTLVDQWRYGANDDPNEDNPTSQWHENNYPFWIAGYILEATDMKLAIITDEKAINVNGGTATAGSWITRELNTRNDPNNLVSLAGNTITIAVAGDYYICGRSLFWQTGVTSLRLKKNGIAIAYALTGYSISGGQSSTTLTALTTLGIGDTLTLEFQCQTTKSVDGLGIYNPYGIGVFSIIELWKLDG